MLERGRQMLPNNKWKYWNQVREILLINGRVKPSARMDRQNLQDQKRKRRCIRNPFLVNLALSWLARQAPRPHHDKSQIRTNKDDAKDANVWALYDRYAKAHLRAPLDSTVTYLKTLSRSYLFLAHSTWARWWRSWSTLKWITFLDCAPLGEDTHIAPPYTKMGEAFFDISSHGLYLDDHHVTPSTMDNIGSWSTNDLLHMP